MIPAPIPGPDDAFFWEGAAAGKLLLQRCAHCGRLRLPPGPMCPGCQAIDWETAEASGRGRVISWIVSRHPTEPDGGEERVVALVELAEGVRLVSNLLGELDGIVPDLPVRAEFRTYDGVTLPQFVPAAP